MARITIDPITRIEGHLRIEATVEGGKVVDAWSSCTMFRGIEIILKDRDPRDAWLFCQRICGVCTMVHALASVRAVENALGITVPDNARIMRNIITAIQFVQDHVIHFYHLHGLDWIDVVSALKADPAKTASVAQSISDWPHSGTAVFAAVQKRVKGLVESGQLGPFANAYWGHPAYKLPRGQPPRRYPLPPGLGMAAGGGKGPCPARIEEPAPADIPRGGDGETRRPEQPERAQCRRDRPDEPGGAAGDRIRGQGVPARPHGRRILLQGVGGLRRRGRQLPDLRRVSQRQPEQQRQSALTAGDHHGTGAGQGAARRSAENRRGGDPLLVRLR